MLTGNDSLVRKLHTSILLKTRQTWKAPRELAERTSSVLSSPMNTVKNLSEYSSSSSSSSSSPPSSSPAPPVPAAAVPPPVRLPLPLVPAAPFETAPVGAKAIGKTSLSRSQSTALPLSQAMSGWSSNTFKGAAGGGRGSAEGIEVGRVAYNLRRPNRVYVFNIFGESVSKDGGQGRAVLP